MELTRREFVTTLGVLAAGLGLSQTDLAKVTEAFGHASPGIAPGLWTAAKPKVIWVHGAECTGCSTSLLSFFEDAQGVAVAGHPTLGNISTATALNIVAEGTVEATGAAATSLTASGHRTLNSSYLNVDGSAYAVNIADVLVDFIDLQYHETVMGMGGDGAYGYLRGEMDSTNATPFVLVVEGAVQDFSGGGYWGKSGAAGDAPWCAISADGTPNAKAELSFDEVVEKLATRAACVAVLAIGQCAAFGGYPACIGPDLVAKPSGTKNQTGAKGVYDFLLARGAVAGHGAATGAANKVVNVPGCPTNPWWFVLTVVAWLVDAVTATPATDTATATGALGILNGALKIKGGVDNQRRLTAVYGNLLHGKYCPRYPKYAARIFASKPGDDGCLKNIGCKGLSTMSSCGRHGWNNQQPQNDLINTAGQKAVLYASTDGTKIGGCCLTAGAPCMGCTEKGYPDAFTPFVVR
jgi:hydrogenase small subunit